jgi:hypothetical protein
MRTSLEREKEGKIIYTCETLRTEIERKLWPKNIEVLDDGNRFSITCRLGERTSLIVYKKKPRVDRLIWQLLVNGNISLEIGTGLTDGPEHGTVEEALQYIKSFMLLVRKREAWVDASTYWETERTDEGIKLVQDLKRYEEGDWE